MAEAEKKSRKVEKEAEQRRELEIEERASPSGRILYDAILREGTEELGRSTSALFWSGLAAGLSMGFSLITEGVLRASIADHPWRALICKVGYSVGFLIVVLGRQQLFTENTLTPILPLLARRDWPTGWNVARLWGVVLLANLIGAALVAWALVDTGALDANVRQAFVEIGREAVGHPWLIILWRGVFAGWLLALMVWLLPFAEAGRVWVILIITYVVGVGHFAHVIAGSVEAFALAAHGEVSWARALAGFVLPTLLGNIVGGVTLVTALAHAQVFSGEPAGKR